jgi:hypothetical protein
MTGWGSCLICASLGAAVLAAVLGLTVLDHVRQDPTDNDGPDPSA